MKHYSSPLGGFMRCTRSKMPSPSVAVTTSLLGGNYLLRVLIISECGIGGRCLILLITSALIYLGECPNRILIFYQSIFFLCIECIFSHVQLLSIYICPLLEISILNKVLESQDPSLKDLPPINSILEHLVSMLDCLPSELSCKKDEKLGRLVWKVHKSLLKHCDDTGTHCSLMTTLRKYFFDYVWFTGS